MSFAKTVPEPIEPDDIVLELRDEHKEALLNLVLMWGTLDGCLGMLAARVSGMEMHEGADRYARLSGSNKLREVVETAPEVYRGVPMKSKMRKIKKLYERNSKLRNLVVHSHCVGHLGSAPSYIVFAPFEREGDSSLAVDAVHLDHIASATKWGAQLRDWCLRLVDATEPERKA